MPLLKQLFKKTNRDLLKRIGFTAFALAIFIIGTNIQVPGTASITKNLGFLELINTMGGGALQNFSIFALGVMPYITATIVMQLLGELIPYFQDLRKQGHTGRQKINMYSRYMGIAFAFIQGNNKGIGSFFVCVNYTVIVFDNSKTKRSNAVLTHKNIAA